MKKEKKSTIKYCETCRKFKELLPNSTHGHCHLKNKPLLINRYLTCNNHQK